MTNKITSKQSSILPAVAVNGLVPEPIRNVSRPVAFPEGFFADEGNIFGVRGPEANPNDRPSASRYPTFRKQSVFEMHEAAQ